MVDEKDNKDLSVTESNGNEISSQAESKPEAVSYTHLDVDKRKC